MSRGSAWFFRLAVESTATEKLPVRGDGGKKFRPEVAAVVMALATELVEGAAGGDPWLGRLGESAAGVEDRREPKQVEGVDAAIGVQVGPFAVRGVANPGAEMDGQLEHVQ